MIDGLGTNHKTIQVHQCTASQGTDVVVIAQKGPCCWILLAIIALEGPLL